MQKQSPIRRILAPHSIGRLEYLLRYAPITLAIYYHIAGDSEPSGASIVVMLAIMVLMIPFAILPRLRNAEMSYWWLVLAIIPYLDRILGILLLAKPAPLKLERNEE
jgi:uncharacterized membrane protein YhaH (DUF805 family)